MTFLDPAGRQFYARWDWTAQATVANLRMAAGFDPHDAGLRSLVAELSESSAHVRDLWETHHVRGKTREPKHLVHPDVGPLVLTYQAFDVRSAPASNCSSTTPNPPLPPLTPSHC